MRQAFLVCFSSDVVFIQLPRLCPSFARYAKSVFTYCHGINYVRSRQSLYKDESITDPGHCPFVLSHASWPPESLSLTPSASLSVCAQVSELPPRADLQRRRVSQRQSPAGLPQLRLPHGTAEHQGSGATRQYGRWRRRRRRWWWWRRGPDGGVPGWPRSAATPGRAAARRHLSDDGCRYVSRHSPRVGVGIPPLGQVLCNPAFPIPCHWCRLL